MKRSTLVKMFLSACLAGAYIVQAFGAEPDEVYGVRLKHLKPIYTTVETFALRDVTYGGCTPVTQPIVFDCPGPRHGTCAITIELATQYYYLSQGWAAFAIAKVDDSLAGNFPAPAQTIATAALYEDIDPGNSATVQWVRPNVPRGWHTLQICVEMGQHPWAYEAGLVGIGPSVVTIAVFRP